MKRLLAITALIAVTLGTSTAHAGAAQIGLAATTIPTISVWVTVYHSRAFDRTIIGSGWMSAGHPFPHVPMTYHNTYYVRAQVYADAHHKHVIADTTAMLTKSSGAPIFLLRRGADYHWDY